MDVKNVLNVSLVNKSFQILSINHFLWKFLFQNKFGKQLKKKSSFKGKKLF
jgi:hypothetical protein